MVAAGQPPSEACVLAKLLCHASTNGSRPTGGMPSVLFPKNVLKKHSSQQSEGLGRGLGSSPSLHLAKHGLLLPMTTLATLDCRHE